MTGKNMPKAEKAVAEKKWELDKVFQKCSKQWLQEGNKYADPEAAAGRTVLTEGCLLKTLVISPAASVYVHTDTHTLAQR